MVKNENTKELLRPSSGQGLRERILSLSAEVRPGGGVWRMLRNEAASEPFSCRTLPVPEGVSASPRKIFPAEQHLFRKDGVQQFRELK